MLPIFENPIVENALKRKRDWADAALIACIREEERAKEPASVTERPLPASGPIGQYVSSQADQEPARKITEPALERCTFEWRRSDFDLLP